MSQTVDPLTVARDAASRQAWRAAFEAYASLDEAGIDAEDLEQYGEAAWWSGKLNEAVRLRERAYVAYAGEGRNVAAARVALTLSWDESNRGSFSVAQGWFATAERQLEGEEESAEHGRVALTRAATAMFAEGNYPLAIENLDRAIRDRPAFRRPRHANARARRQGTRAREERRLRAGARAHRRGNGRRRQRGAAAVLDYARLLHDHQLLPGRGRPPSRRRVDGSSQPLV